MRLDFPFSRASFLVYYDNTFQVRSVSAVDSLSHMAESYSDNSELLRTHSLLALDVLIAVYSFCCVQRFASSLVQDL